MKMPLSVKTSVCDNTGLFKKINAKLNGWYVCFRDFNQLIVTTMERSCL